MDAIESDSSIPSASVFSISRPSSASSIHPVDTPKDVPAGAPSCSLFEVRHTPTAGRAVFATQDIPAGTLVWRSDDLTLSVLLRDYRREVCGQCFDYVYGRDLDIRDKTVGFTFCSKACQEKWREEKGEIGVQAWTAVETLVKKRSKEDSEMVDADLPRPKSKEIKQAWESVAAQAALIRTAREGEQMRPLGEDDSVPVTKQHKKAVAKALQEPISPDVMSFCVSGIVWRHRHPEDWEKVLALANDKTPYHNSDDLRAFTRTYLHLLAILPLPLLPLVTAEVMFALSSRDSHNSFGIRSLEDDGSEFFGYGCWPAASYFNHSCAPNVEKNREDRAWYFKAGRDIEKGQELCITYLSAAERKLSRGNRMLRLKKYWGFDCACERCEAL
ncbi:SET domain-containing protein [Decorospora gaudefroyi]|uniref:SET domain-containing protein n=1 Tax=Decorospora gaudefroyi TaxID=184978 RepID=A0A6A5KMY9_9PLEO|nr:SET domain-containing protein [Decorospora gaudefroyi]